MLDADRSPNAVSVHAGTSQVDFEVDCPPPARSTRRSFDHHGKGNGNFVSKRVSKNEKKSLYQDADSCSGIITLEWVNQLVDPVLISFRQHKSAPVAFEVPLLGWFLRAKRAQSSWGSGGGGHYKPPAGPAAGAAPLKLLKITHSFCPVFTIFT